MRRAITSGEPSPLGSKIATEALVSRASKLPRVELTRPKTLIGKNTVASMQAGIVYGFVGQVEGIINRMKKEMDKEPTVVANRWACCAGCQ
jgi:type III pantothenate kinase